jgi:DNA-binding transcriptional ArsR family regulator
MENSFCLSCQYYIDKQIICQYTIYIYFNKAKLGTPPMDTTTLDLEKMKSSAAQACRLMKVLSNPDRLMLLCQLSQGEKRVGELEEILGIVQPTLSQQLTVLREEELVSTRREGKNIYYQIASPQALAVMTVLFDQFCGSQAGASA